MNVLYTTSATAVGGRAGTVRTDDGRLDLSLAKPPGLGGVAGTPGTPGTNPEQLFAAGYSACFQNSLEAAARRRRIRDSTSVVTAVVEIGRRPDSTLALRVTMEVALTGVDEATARALIEEADALCPYSNAIRGNVEVTKTLTSLSPAQ
jgi:Ohr subfamily peroxiredoxin